MRRIEMRVFALAVVLAMVGCGRGGGSGGSVVPADYSFDRNV